MILVTTDAYREAFVKDNQDDLRKLTEDQTDLMVSSLERSLILGVVIGIPLDFIMRFLVINSLYHKYREERITNQVV